MLSLFQRKRPSPIAIVSPTLPAALPKGLTRPEPAASLLATPRRQRLLEHIWQRTSLSRRQFASLYLAPLERYADLVQHFPASETHHHAYPGGMLDHGLEIVAFALKLRQSHLMPAGAKPEDQAAQAEAWTAGTAYAALLHDIGKVAVDLHVEYADSSIWHPWHGPLNKPYRFRYRKDREYRLHGAATGLLYTRVLDSNILDWLSEYPDLWSALLYVLAGQYEHAGILGDLVTKADQASVAQALGGDPAKAMAAPRHALQRKLLEGLRHLLREELKVNQAQASDGWLTEDALWLVSKTVSDKLRAHLLSQGIDGIPSNNTAVFTVLQDHGIVQPTPDGKAIWKATVVSGTGWTHSFTFLRLSPALIWELGKRPEPFAGTVTIDESMSEETVPAPPLPALATPPESDLARAALASPPATEPSPPQPMPTDLVADMLSMLDTDEPSVGSPSPTAHPAPVSAATPGMLSAPAPAASPDAPSNETASGEHFMAWLKKAVASHRLIINDAKALVHTVSGTAYLVSPGLFQRYAQEHPQIQPWAKAEAQQDWQWAQKRFEKLGLHRKRDGGLNIWSCEVVGPRKAKRLHGYLLADASVLFDAVPPDNPHLTVVSATPATAPARR